VSSNFNQNLIRLCKVRELSQRQLAKQTGLTQSKINYYESVESKRSIANLESIAQGLEMSIADLFTDSPPRTETEFFDVDARTFRKLKSILSLPKKYLHTIYSVADGLIAKKKLKAVSDYQDREIDSNQIPASTGEFLS
jgi:transcriptional regulator with XRE-family HTH domain